MASVKDDGRGARLSLEANFHLRQELNQIARKNCKEPMDSFAQCAQAHGMLVVLHCRAENRASESAGAAPSLLWGRGQGQGQGLSAGAGA